MQPLAKGYTIVEVLIVLAVTSMLFFSAILVFQGQNNKTDFSQSMQDLRSKFNNYANQVQNSSYPGNENYSCSISATNRPALTTPPAANPGALCIYLGLAIQAIPGTNSLNIYTVLGDRDDWSGGTDSGNLSTSISQSNPEIATTPGSSPPAFVLTDTYPLGAGATIKSTSPPYAKVGATTYTDYDLLGIYNGLSQDQAVASTNGTSSLVLRSYDCSGATCNSNKTQKCIEEATGVCSTLKYIDQWGLCIQDNGSSQTVLLTVVPAPGGISTKVSYTNC